MPHLYRTEFDDPRDEALADALNCPTRKLTVMWSLIGNRTRIHKIIRDTGEECTKDDARMERALQAIKARRTREPDFENRAGQDHLDAIDALARDPHAEPTDAEIERGAQALLAYRGFGFYTDPMEGGQNAYDISLQALEEVRAVLAAVKGKT